MCSPALGRALRQALLALSMIGSLPGIGSSQSTAEARQELDQLLPQWRAANAAIADAELVRRRKAGAVMVEGGHLRILADSAIAIQVGEAAAIASASLDRVFGADARLVSGYSIVARLEPVARNSVRGQVIRVRRSEGDERSPVVGSISWGGNVERTVAVGDENETRAGLVRAFEAVGAAPLHATLDDEMRWWFRSSLPATTESRDELESIYIELATASTDIARRCFGGDLMGCKQVLDLAPVADPILEGYTATQRRYVVQGNADRLRTSAKAAEFDRCVVGLDDAACVTRLRDLSADRLSQSFSTTGTRRSFARWAIAVGAPGAYSRLRSTVSMPPDERFASAASMPVDSLVASWRAHLMTAQPARSSVPVSTAITTLLWIGACGALALRSSKWR